MYIREYMKSPVITVAPNTLLDEALRLMHEKKVRRLPVVEGGKLIGLVTRRGLMEATPESPLPLSIWGAHYQLSRMKVRDIMITDLVTVTPDNTVEEATTIAERKKIGTLPVIDKTGNLVGILTVTDLHHLLTQVMGFGQSGVRLHIHDLGKTLHRQILRTMSDFPVDILSAFSVPLASGQEDFIVHLDTEEAEPIAEELKKLDLNVEIRKH